MNSQHFLNLQGATIATALNQQGYQAERVETQFAWRITRPDQDWLFVLTFLPRPTAQWRLLPAEHTRVQAEIYSVIESAIGGRR